MLAASAVTHFNNLLGGRMADASTALAQACRDFERDARGRGQSPDGGGYAARLAGVYEQNLKNRAQLIVETAKQVHADFGKPLDDGVDAELKKLGEQALSTQSEMLKEAFARHLRRFGVTEFGALDMSYACALSLTMVSNGIGDYFWTQRNVPMSNPAKGSW